MAVNLPSKHYHGVLKELNYPVERSLKFIKSNVDGNIQIVANNYYSNFDINNIEIKEWIENGGILVYLTPGNIYFNLYSISPEIKGDIKIFKYQKGLVIAANLNHISNNNLVKETDNAYKLLEEIDRYDYDKLYFNERRRHNQGFSNIDLDKSNIRAVCTPVEIEKCREEVQMVEVDEALLEYIVKIVSETRNNPIIEIGSSPRGSIALLQCSKACAAYYGRNFIIPDDIKKMTIPTLRHRIILKPELVLEGVKPEQVLNEILNKIEVPR